MKITPRIAEIAKIVEPFDGWLSVAEGAFLYETAKREAARGAVVEVGSWKGKSTVYLAYGVKDSGTETKVYAIDPHTGAPEHHVILNNENIWTFEEFKKNIKTSGIEAYVEPITDRSLNVAKKWDMPVGFAWIDGAHAFEAAQEDFDAWFPRLVEGGVIAYHDATFQDVRRVMYHNVFTSHHVRGIGIVDSITYATKINPANFRLADSLRSKTVYALSLFHHLRHLPLPKGVRKPLKAAYKKWAKILE